MRRWAPGSLATNGPSVAARLRDLRAVIDDWLAALERPGGPDETALAGRLEAVRARLDGIRRVDELVLVVPRAAVPGAAAWYGLRPTASTSSWPSCVTGATTAGRDGA